MSDAPRFFGLDTIMMDVVLKIVALPQRGGDAEASENVITTGGGFNAMSAAARHGMGTVYGGRLGRGPFSDIARGALVAEGIENPVPPDPNLDVGYCIVLVDADGERTFVTAPGSEGRVSATDLEGLEVSIGDYVFMSGYNVVYERIGQEFTKWLAELESGVVVAFDPGPRVMDIDASRLRITLQRTDWLLCNADEAQHLSGSPVPEDAAPILLGSCAHVGVVVRDGSAGCVVVTDDLGPMRVPGYVVDVCDTNGAGDTHNGVFLSEVARGTDVVEAARRANAAAALAISQFGPATCPTRDEVSEWYAQFS